MATGTIKFETTTHKFTKFFKADEIIENNDLSTKFNGDNAAVTHAKMYETETVITDKSTVNIRSFEIYIDTTTAGDGPDGDSSVSESADIVEKLARVLNLVANPGTVEDSAKYDVVITAVTPITQTDGVYDLPLSDFDLTIKNITGDTYPIRIVYVTEQ